MSRSARNGQSGITAIGFLILAVLVGVVGLAGLKLTPMYIKNMALSRLLQDLPSQLRGEVVSPVSIRTAIDKRLEIETMELPKDSIKIAPSRNGYSVHITYENRAPYAGGIYLLLEFDKQVEIQK
ncbi:MAG TPA: DUF4845 domain-containing protein [Gammaproteobacteria bacterium]|nr:DUF4845 domain-containing protein [Gammaproteobacteria bacterium]